MLSCTPSLLKPMVDDSSSSLVVPFAKLNRTLPLQGKALWNAQSPAKVIPAADIPSLQDMCVAAMTTKTAVKAIELRDNAAIGDPVGKTDTWGKHAMELIRLIERAVARRVQLSSEVHHLRNPSYFLFTDEACFGTLSPSTKGHGAQGTPDQLCRSKIITTGKCCGRGDHELSEGCLLASSGESVASIGTVREGQADVGILFSGGVDSAVLAAMADRCVDPHQEIDLINVAFEQKGKVTADPFQVPDRSTALSALKELNPQRQWNLVQVNVDQVKLDIMREKHISRLVYPLSTVLDDSIGCAMWFAACGEGILYSENSHSVQLYRSHARILLVGIGADEQLAGYSRHRQKFMSHGWSGLLDEMELDIKRLSSRNLGRDDRCIADHQREARFPYLDEDVVDYLQCLPIWNKVDLTLPRGMGEKRLLRESASRLGLSSTSALPKRAIQFGTRIAKLTDTAGGKDKGRNPCKKLVPMPSDSDT